MTAAEAPREEMFAELEAMRGRAARLSAGDGRLIESRWPKAGKRTKPKGEKA